MNNDISFTREEVESGAYYAAASVLLIGLRHMKEHDIAHPIGVTAEEWRGIVEELIWMMEFILHDTPEHTDTPAVRERYSAASSLLGRYFADIWC